MPNDLSGYHKIRATVFSIENGNTIFKDVKSIRILSKKYNILIMEDYLPVIGEVDGEVQIVMDSHVESIKNVIGFYKHSKNEFELLIKEYKE